MADNVAETPAMLDFGGDGVTEGLRAECKAEWNSLLHDSFSTPMAVEHLAQFAARHRQLAAASERGRIVAWLRECDKEWDYTYPNLLTEAAEQIEVGEHMPPADAIERGEV